MGETRSRFEASVGPDGRIQTLAERLPQGGSRPIPAESPEGLEVLAAGRDILYRFDDERRLRDLPYPELLEAMRREIHLLAHKASHGELLDEPEAVPALRRLLAGIEAAAAAFRRAREDRRVAG